MTPKFDFEGPIGKVSVEVAGEVRIFAQRYPEDDQIEVEVGSKESQEEVERAKRASWGRTEDQVLEVRVKADEQGRVVLNEKEVGIFDGATTAFWLMTVGVTKD